MQRHMSYFQKHRDITSSRVTNFIADNQWKDVNIQSALYSLRVDGEPHIKLSVWSAPGEDRPKFEYAIRQKFTPTEVGTYFGPSWSTHWFKVEIRIPKAFVGKPVQLLFDTNSEAMVWSSSGIPLQGITGGTGDERHVDYLLTKNAQEQEPQRLFYIEMACNSLFGNGDYHVHPQDRDIFYKLNSVELVAPNFEAWGLYYDMQVLTEMSQKLPADSVRGWQALAAANQIVNKFDWGDLSSIRPARMIANEFLGSAATKDAHQAYAIGHCHIDTAWLWPFAETRRKTARSWATQIQLMEEFPEHRFAASQAQQFEWLKEDYPSLFVEIQEKARSGQFIPLGSTWVEMDCNMPSGESLVRQFLLGQRFYQDYFGKRSEVFWLPDTFGYSSQLPQIVLKSGAKYFFTQKLSWNNINKFPNTTFRWVGLDGSSVLTHMAPSETYSAQCRPGELIESVKKHKDIAYSNESLYLFGNGDGGGGPLRAMLERLRRMKDVDGLPKVKVSDPVEFYKSIEKNAKELVSWKGELYFELHRGTYTSQSNNKRFNRYSETLMREVEALSTIARFKTKAFTYPKDEITRLWKLICLNQFHDVIPGSAIGKVYQDSNKLYEDIFESGDRVRHDALNALYGPAIVSRFSEAEVPGLLVFNSTTRMRSEIIPICPTKDSSIADVSSLNCIKQFRKHDGAPLILAANVPGHSIQILDPGKQPDSSTVSVRKDLNGNFVMENELVRVTIDQAGLIRSYYDIKEKRELVPKGSSGNVFEMYEDIPLYWDAWDIEIYSLEKYKGLTAGNVAIVDEGPLVASISVDLNISTKSRMVQTISLSAISPRLDFDCDIKWHENRKCLKVSFNWDIYSDFATYETQYGVIQRPTHRNTTWDMAKFEVCGHKFADLSEFGYGVALLNDCKYGYATLENTMTLSLIRAPKAPDENCDMGTHRFRYAVFPHKGAFNESNVVYEGIQFNSSMLHIPADISRIEDTAFGASPCNSIQSPFFSLSNAPNIILDTVKLAEDDSNSYIVRMYESYGGHANALLTTKLTAKSVHLTNFLEESTSTLEWLNFSSSVNIPFKPFEVVTVKFVV